ncbi:MAG: two-component regulator propeller domain-containing protein [Calditrichia bacterium]
MHRDIATSKLSYSIKRFLLLLILHSALASSLYSSDWKTTILPMQDRRSPNSIFCILQDSRGILWIGTDNGLYRYNGTGFTNYIHDRRNSSSIADNLVFSIAEDATGRIWIGSSRGTISCLSPPQDQFQRVHVAATSTSQLDTLAITALHYDPQNGLLAGTSGAGIFQKDRAGNFQPHPLVTEGHIRSVLLASNNDLWIAVQKKGVLCLKPSNLNNSTEQHILNLPLPTPTSLHEDTNGLVWIGTTEGLFRYTPGQAESSIASPLLPKEIITGITSHKNHGQEQSENLWIATLTGLYQLAKNDAGSIVRYLSQQRLQALAIDRSGNIWAGLQQEGLAKLTRPRKRFAFYQSGQLHAASSEADAVRSLYAHKAMTGNFLWIGTMLNGLIGLDRDTGKTVSPLQNVFSNQDQPAITGITAYNKSEFWVATWGGGVFRIRYPNLKVNTDRRNWESIQYKDQLRSKVVLDILPDSVNSTRVMWLGTDQGLECMNLAGDIILTASYSEKDSSSLSDNRVQSNSILRDKHGYLWVGTWHGLNRSTTRLSEAPTTLNFKRYLANYDNPNTIGDNRITALYEDQSNSDYVIWIGTHGGGLNRIIIAEDGTSQITHFTLQDGLPDNVVYAICGSANQRLWISTNDGLCEFDPRTETARNYDERDGLPETRFFWGAGHQNANKDRLFFGTTNGVVEFESSKSNQFDAPPEVVISNFSILNASDSLNQKMIESVSDAMHSSSALTLGPNQNSFSVEFALPDYRLPAKNQYAYQLEGFDSDWIFNRNRPFVTYTNIDPGSYRLRVKGKNSDGLWVKNETILQINIAPPFWKSWWFMTMSVLFIGGLIALVVSYHVKQLLKVERLRTKLAADLHDDIGANLTEVAILSEVIARRPGLDAKTSSSLQRISDTSRNLIDSMSDIVWLVNPRRDSLHDLILRLQDTNSELLGQLDIAFRAENLPDLQTVSLPMEHRQHLFLIFKEALNNAIKYSRCSLIHLKASVRKGELKMSLSDNGVGFNPNSGATGNGLSNMKQRADLIGGEVAIESSGGGGTTISFSGLISKR